MKYFKLLFLLLLSNVIISQASQTKVKTDQQTTKPASFFKINEKNINPPFCLDSIDLKGATIVKQFNKKKESNYYMHDSREYVTDGSKGKIIKDFKQLFFRTSKGNIDFFPLQKVGQTLTESSCSKNQFDTYSRQYINDVTSLSPSKKVAFLEAMAINPSLAKAWVTLEIIGFPLNDRTNLENLNIVSAYFDKYSDRTPIDVQTTAKLFKTRDIYLTFLPKIVYNNPVKGTRYEDFENVSGFKGNFHQSEYSFYLWSIEEWKVLESYFKTNNINGEWPPNNGGYNEIHNVKLTPGLKFDRYGNALTIDPVTGPLLGGTFTSPFIDGKPYSFGQRALNKPENAYDFYYVIEVLKELPFTSLNATVIPWFGQVGNGKQAMWNITRDPDTGYPLTWNKLVEFGYIKVIIKSSPSGKYPQFVNFAIQ